MFSTETVIHIRTHRMLRYDSSKWGCTFASRSSISASGTGTARSEHEPMPPGTGRRQVQQKTLDRFLEICQAFSPVLRLKIAGNRQCFPIYHFLPLKNQELSTFHSFWIKNRPLKCMLPPSPANNVFFAFCWFFIKQTCISLRNEYIIYTALRVATNL